MMSRPPDMHMPTGSAAVGDVMPLAQPVAPVMKPSRRVGGRKIACVNCHEVRKTCDEGRPCGRCTKRGLECKYPLRKQSRRATHMSNGWVVRLLNLFSSSSTDGL
ncbi:hypothetical protein DICSQDRAFT_157701 [Dichomitus squalens LYAD-421 SS1]|uniref:Zn(2)-C6 fungal-type domain-containing protein n=2 Tax=Dichomitus squalens TaxID=114155 RepID=A0A4Q9MDV1_9APHY|nr:uncharacterized protein DICSQDRAFT_157701 [Dichomitus squalens LYAD-421 SS1]EJF56770.1 hypothetical protein DICSQDRAFT_157701 [Dichomitus squalens LYAD-421 SS1]TBU25419.1 hypothetical protein BD311DRAFT_669662 [Dichomitus squalens]